MEGVTQTLVLVVQRYRRQRARFLALAFGFGVAGMLLSGTTIYSETMRTTALTFALAQIQEEEAHLLVRVPTGRATIGTFERLTRRVTSVVEEEASAFTGPVVSSSKSATFYLSLRGDVPLPPIEIRPRSFFLSLEGVEERLQVLEGVFPSVMEQAASEAARSVVVPVLIGEEPAHTFNLRVGSRLSLLPYWDDQFDQVTISIVGIGRVRDPQDPYWDGRLSPLSYPESTYQTLPLLVPKESLFGGVGQYFKNLSYDFSWLAPVQEERLAPDNAQETATAFRSLRQALLELPEQPTMHTQIITALETYATRLFFTGVPLTLLVTQVEGIALLYLVILGFFLVDRQRAELALLRSRGASTLHLLLPFLVEGLLLAGLTVALAPLLSAGLIALLGLTPWLEPLSGEGLLPVSLPGKAFLLAGLGAGLGLGALLLPAFLASRSTGVQLRQRVGRAHQPPFFLRYRLDVLVLAAVVVIGWEVSQQGSVVRFTLAGQAVVNPILYALPSLLVLAAAMLFLRVFPLLTSLAARALEPRAPAWLLLGLWYLARGPGTSGALVLLLALATGTTLFAASFGPTLESNARERIYYETGAPLRLEGIRVRATGESFNLVDQVAATPGVQVVSPIYRGQGTDHSSILGSSYTILALDPSTFEEVAWYRDDFSQQELFPILSLLAEYEAAPMQSGMAIPLEADHLGVWVQPGRQEPTMKLYARVQDANGRNMDYELGRLDFTEWRYLERPLASAPVLRNEPPFRPQLPLSLQALFIEETRGGDTGPGIVYLDDLQVRGEGLGQPLTLDAFEEPGRWWVIQDSLERSPDSFDYTGPSAHDGQRAGAFSWGSTSLFSVQGITPIPPQGPLAAIASASFLARSGRDIGDRLVVSAAGQAVPIRIVERVEFFPTLDPYQEEFLIVNFQRLQRHGSLLVPRSEFLPTELWLTGDGAQAVAQVEETLAGMPVQYRSFLDLRDLLATAQVDPFILGGWMGWLIIAFVATALVSIAGFVTYAVLGLERRQGSVAVLESLGMSSRQVLGTVALEFLFLLVAGGLLGALMGSWLGSLLLPYLDVTGTGEAAVPPLVVVRTWGGVFLVYGGIAVVFGLLLAFVLRWFSHLALQRVLKLEEV